MTRDGLVERNAATGEETRVSQRGQDFNLRQNTQDAPRSFEQQAKAGGSRHQPPPPTQAPEARQDFDIRQNNTQDIPQSADFTTRHNETLHRQPLPMEQAADFRQDIHAPDNPDFSPQSTYNTLGEQSATPMEVARPTARSYEARSHEASAGPKPQAKQAAYQHHNATVGPDNAAPYETWPSTESARQSAEKPLFQHQNSTENWSNIPHRPATGNERLNYTDSPESVPIGNRLHHRGNENQQRFTTETAGPEHTGEVPVPDSAPTGSRRLKFTEKSSQPSTGAKSRQHGTKYQQQFTPEAAGPEHTSEVPAPDSAPASSRRLKFTEESSQPSTGAKSRQHGTKYQQQFTPEAAGPEHTGEVPVPDSAPAGSRRLKFTEEFSQPSTGAKPQQHGTKYQQQFTPEAAKPGYTGKTAESPPPPQSGRLQFTTDEIPVDNKLSKLQGKSAKTAAKLEKARGKLPTKKRIKTQRVYDEAKGKTKTKFTLEKEVIPQGGKKPPLPARAGKAAGRGITRVGINKIHQKIGEVENDNLGVKAAHKIEQTAENAYRGGKSVRSVYRFVKDRPYRRIAKLEQKALKTNIKLDYRKALNENPKLKSNLFSRLMQKQKIKRQYAKAARETQKAAAKTAKKTGETLANAAKAVVHAIKSHPAVFATIGALALLIIIIMSAVSSCSNMAVGGMGAVFGTSYLSADADINNAELAYTQWETDLQMQINNVESDRPGFDEYRYDVDDIGHDPYELMAFLTAAYQDFTYAEIQAVLQQMFAEQYQLSFVEEVEVRYRTETHIDPETGESYDVEVPYNWYVLNINLTARSFTDIITPRLSSDQLETFNLLMQSKGNRQYAYSPFDFNWLPYVSCYYGWRVHPITGAKDYHKAVDIAVSEGTEIIAAHDGTVTTVAYDNGYGYYVVLDDGKGLVTKYAHCSTFLVSAGQTVAKGDPIAKVGNTGSSTGPHLHFEVIKDGQYLNPLFFAITNDDGSGRIPPGSPGGPAYADYPGEPITDADYAAMIAEAEKHLGKKYVFGASGPNNFDCSGFVSWVLDKSGVKPMRRTNAQGIYNMCTPVSPDNAKPGDLIFFSGTYSTPNAVSHIGIYVGNGMMLHCGNPIQYTSINTRYWQDHFYAFARIN